MIELIEGCKDSDLDSLASLLNLGYLGYVYKKIQLIFVTCFLLKYLINSIYLANCVKQGRAVTFMKYFDSVVSLLFLPKTLTWNKLCFPHQIR